MTVESQLLREARRLFRAADQKRVEADELEKSCQRLRGEADRLEAQARDAKRAHAAMDERNRF